MSTEPTKEFEVQRARLGLTYTRVSTVLQANTSLGGLEVQRSMGEVLESKGWESKDILDVDDLGISGSYGTPRDGFNRMLEMVSEEKVGAIAVADLSRLSRSPTDIFRMIELCAATETLIFDLQKTYRPWVLEEFGTLLMRTVFSTMELQSIKSKMSTSRAALLKNGKMKIPVPLGYMHDKFGKIIIDPDEEIQTLIRKIFDLMAIHGSGSKVTAELIKSNMQMITLKLVKDVDTGLPTGEKIKVKSNPTTDRVRAILRNPTYAGAFTWGRVIIEKKFVSIVRTRRRAVTIRDYNKWKTLIFNNHYAYIDWQTYLQNVKVLQENSFRSSTQGAPREGNALLQGLAYCGFCNKRMRVGYHVDEKDHSKPKRVYYRCLNARKKHGDPSCQNIMGKLVEAEVIRQVTAVLSTANIDLTLKDLANEERPSERAIRSLNMELKQAEVVAKNKKDLLDIASDDGKSREVKEILMQEWSKALDLVGTLKKKISDITDSVSLISKIDKSNINEIPVTAKQVLLSHQITSQDKKTILRCLIDKIIIIKRAPIIELKILWKSGHITDGQVRMPKNSAWRVTPQRSIDYMMANREGKSFKQLAEEMNTAGYKSFSGKPFTPRVLNGLYSRYARSQTKLDEL